MTELANVLHRALRETRFEGTQEGQYKADEVAHLYAARTDQLSYLRGRELRTIVPETALAEVVARVAQDLDDFIEPASHRIGTGLGQLMGGPSSGWEPTVPEFAKTLLVAAARLGPERATETVLSWREGEPYRYRRVLVLAGVRNKQPFTLHEAIRVERLPDAGEDLKLPFPLDWRFPFGNDMFERKNFTGRTTLTIDATAEPTLYRPMRSREEEPEQKLRETWAGGRMQSLQDEGWRRNLADALSLACNRRIGWTHAWRDFGDLAAFNDLEMAGNAGGFGWLSGRLDEQSKEETVQLEQHHLEAAGKFAEGLQDNNAQNPRNRAKLNVAIERWAKAKRSDTSLTDKFIELRIALEALYGRTSQGELAFSVAVFGARHVGVTAEDRKRYYKTIKSAYKQGSAAVHEGNVNDDATTRGTFDEALEICRVGILKRIEEKQNVWVDQNTLLE